MIEWYLVSRYLVFEAIVRSSHFRALPRMGKLNRSTPLLQTIIWPIRHNNLEVVRDRTYINILSNRKSHMGFQSVPKPVTLSVLGRHFALYHTIRQLSEPTASNPLQLESYCHRHSCAALKLLTYYLITFTVWKAPHWRSNVNVLTVDDCAHMWYWRCVVSCWL